MGRRLLAIPAPHILGVAEMETVDLSSYKNPPWHDKGRGFAVRSVWHLVNALFLQNPINPSSKLKIVLLRLFGARIGQGVIFKPSVNVKSPWLLEVGDHTWIGERVWLDSYFPIRIGSHVCVSQDAYLCTGNHDWTDPSFALKEGRIVIEDGAWIGARATLLPGAHVETHAVIAGGSVLSSVTEPYTIYAGNPAAPIKQRVIKRTAPNNQSAAPTVLER
ncbi:MAG TPA: WcaF family extracellular polysaccharide biosynthesis acetyltransferase [Chthonomonadales bacterium]|nr:WcaF family extracellular polysaccharide biosynthesis acetyltransferase [Chthonomonadales bacterium]